MNQCQIIKIKNTKIRRHKCIHKPFFFVYFVSTILNIYKMNFFSLLQKKIRLNWMEWIANNGLTRYVAESIYTKFSCLQWNYWLRRDCIRQLCQSKSEFFFNKWFKPLINDVVNDLAYNEINCYKRRRTNWYLQLTTTKINERYKLFNGCYYLLMPLANFID